MGPPVSMPTIPSAIRAAAATWPHAEALIGTDGAGTTFDELWEGACSIAGSLAGSGIAVGDRVAIWAPNTPAWAMVHAGALCAGAAVVPLNTRYTAHEATDILNRSEARVVIAATEFLGRAYATELEQIDLAATPTIVRLGESAAAAPDEIAAALATHPMEADAAEVERRLTALGPGDISHVQFTSGTTGQPKGAMLRHGASVVTSLAWIHNTGLTHGDRYPVVAPFSHLGGHKTGLLTCVLAGATAIPVPVLNIADLASTIRTTRSTFLQGPPTLFHGLVALARTDSRSLSSIRVCVTGAAVVPPSLVRDVRATLGAEVFTAYGLTETTGVCTMTRPGDSIKTVASTCGRPLDGVEVDTLDETGASVGTDRPGEVIVRGPNVMAGYLGDPEATAAVVHDGWLRTGDIGTIGADGCLTIVDRLTDMIVVGGLNVYPAEVEHAIIEHPDVDAVSVVGAPDDRLGEVPVAFVIAARNEATLGESVGRWCVDRLAGFKIPRRFTIVDDLPTNAAGKVAKSELRDRAAEETESGS